MSQQDFDEVRFHILQRLDDLKALEKEVVQLKIQMATIKGQAAGIAFVVGVTTPFIITFLKRFQ